MRIKQAIFLTPVSLVLLLSACGQHVSPPATPAATPTPAISPVPTATFLPVPTAGWVKETNAATNVSFAYPPTWKMTACIPGDKIGTTLYGEPDTRYYLGLTSTPSSVCFSGDTTPSLFIDIIPSNATPTFVLDPAACGGTVASSGPILLDGFTGTRQSITYPLDTCSGQPIISETIYKVAVPGQNITVDYQYRTGDPADLTADVETLVQQTLKAVPAA